MLLTGMGPVAANLNFYLSLTKYNMKTCPLLKRHAMKTYWGGGVEMYIYTFLILTLDGCKWPASRPSRFTPGVRASGKSRDSSVGIVLSCGLDDRDSRLLFPAGAGNFSLHHRVQNGSGAHPTSYPMRTSGFFPGSKAAGT
jgi:hypothetical protein